MLLIVLIGIFSLCIGSFLNVIIYRTPILLKHHWQKECADFLNVPLQTSHIQHTFNLFKPRSHCPHCHHSIHPAHNIPLLSYLWLKGSCAYCKKRISMRYFFVELITLALSICVAIHFGFTEQTLFGLILTWGLMSLAFVDVEHHLLPDSMTLPLLWLGLLISLRSVFTDPPSAILGASIGYLVLWSLNKIFKFFTSKQGMGEGDFKLLALLGAWLGWQALPLILLLASILGTFMGLMLLKVKNKTHNTPIPFGPYLAIAGWISILWGTSITQLYLNLVGF